MWYSPFRYGFAPLALGCPARLSGLLKPLRVSSSLGLFRALLALCARRFSSFALASGLRVPHVSRASLGLRGGDSPASLALCSRYRQASAASRTLAKSHCALIAYPLCGCSTEALPIWGRERLSRFAAMPGEPGRQWGRNADCLPQNGRVAAQNRETRTIHPFAACLPVPPRFLRPAASCASPILARSNSARL